MARNDIIDGQINIDNDYEVNVIEVNKSIKFFAVIYTYDNKIIDIPKEEIKYRFENLILEPFDDVEPVLNIYDIDDDGVLFTYGDRKKFNKDFQNVYDEGKVVDTTKLILENFTFLYYDFESHHIAIIYNKSVSTWQRALSLFLSSSEGKADVRPFVNNNIKKQLPFINITSLEFVTSNTSFDENTAFFKHLDKNFKNDLNVDLQKVNLKVFFGDGFGKIAKYVNFDKMKSSESFKLIADDFVYDVVNETLTLTQKIELPKTLSKGSSNIKMLKKKMIRYLKQYTII